MTSPSFEKARDEAIEALGNCWARDQLSDDDYKRLVDAAAEAKTLSDLTSVMEEPRAGFENARVVAGRIRKIAKELQRESGNGRGRSLDQAQSRLVGALKELRAMGRMSRDDFERLVQNAQMATTPAQLLAVGEEVRAGMEKDRQVWARLQDALNWDKPAEPPRGDAGSAGARKLRRLDGAALAARLAPGSSFASRPGYEDRPGQREMLRFVVDCFNDGGTGLVEAGTGTGKSLAYLVSAADWARRNSEKTIVSTNTINLQEQIVNKDLPMVAEALDPSRVKWALFKGRGNYVSIRRARLAAESAGELFEDERSSDIDALTAWLDKTRDGTRSDLPFTPAGDVWDEVKSDSDACLGKKCPHYDECHYYRARRDVALADVLVVNHALFFTDLKVRISSRNYDNPAVLPRYRRVIFDEAHHLETAATNAMQSKVARPGVLKALSRLQSRRKGLLASTAVALRAKGGPLAESLLERVGDRAPQLVAAARARADDCFGAVAAWKEAHAGTNGSIRLPTAAGLEPAQDPETLEALESFLLSLRDLCNELRETCERLSDSEEDLGGDLQGRLLDLRSSMSRLDDAGASLRRGLLPRDCEDADWVRWIETRPHRAGRTEVVVKAAPVQVAPLLQEHLFRRVDTAVLTSATLAMDGGFDHLKQWVGLDAQGLHVRERVVDSPFDYRKQSLLVVVARRSGPERSAGRRWSEPPPDDVAQLLQDLAAVAGGGVLALFTSHKALQGVAGCIDRHGDAGRPVFVQGRKSRHLLIREFASAGNGILLGTDSFWEGVDVPGRSLSAVLIHKLPFLVPGEPVTAAREDVMRRLGRDPFRAYSLPVAGLRLKQGIGRLIRTCNDRGVVVLLDERIETMSYGAALKSALPPAPVHYEEWPTARRRLKEFYVALAAEAVRRPRHAVGEAVVHPTFGRRSGGEQSWPPAGPGPPSS